MENRAHALAAGLFTLLLGTGVIAVAAWFSGDTVPTTDYVLVSTHPVSGLNLQAPVRFRGVTVGKVVSINFNPLEPRIIEVAIAVRSDTPLSQGTFAQLGSQGVTGLSYVILDDDGKKPQALLPEGDMPARIAVRPSFMDSVSNSGQELIENAGEVAKRINALLADDNQKHIVSAVRNLDHMSVRISSLAATLEPAVKSLPALAADAGLALKRADALMANLNQRVEAFERAAKGAERLGDSGAALSDALLNETLPRANQLADELQRAVRGVERTLGDLDEQPHSLIFGRNPLPPGPGEPGFGARGTR
jgi:phospholipid/cholesterol/gamma-HCH transport system substrate-binding protein